MTSHCNVSFPGWAHEIVRKDPKNWSCYKAVQRDNIGSGAVYAAEVEAPAKVVSEELYKPETSLVEAINAAHLSWTATEYPQFAGKVCFVCVECCGA